MHADTSEILLFDLFGMRLERLFALFFFLVKVLADARLGVSKKWGSCNYAVDLSFVAAGDWLVRYQSLLPVPGQKS